MMGRKECSFAALCTRKGIKASSKNWCEATPKSYEEGERTGNYRFTGALATVKNMSWGLRENRVFFRGGGKRVASDFVRSGRRDWSEV